MESVRKLKWLLLMAVGLVVLDACPASPRCSTQSAGCGGAVNFCDMGEEPNDCDAGSCDMPPPDPCTNHVKDGDETGIDCGGSKCKPCSDGDCGPDGVDPGKRCTSNDMCGGGEGCIENQCLTLCDGKNNTCPANSLCCSSTGGSGCFPRAQCCTRDDCKGPNEGYFCGCGHKCVPCQADADCKPSEMCDRATGKCHIGCNDSTQCKGGEVCDPDHVCRVPCMKESDCGNGTHCCANRCMAAACVATIAGNGQRGPADADAADAYVGGVTAIAAINDHNGNRVYFTDTRSTGIHVFYKDTQKIRRFAGKRYGCREGTVEDAEMGTIYGLAAANDGNLYATDSVCNVVWRIDMTQNPPFVTVLAGGLASAGEVDGAGKTARFNYPAGMAHFGGALYVADHYGPALRRVDLAGNVTTLAGMPNTLHGPYSVAADGFGNLYVGEYNGAPISNLYKVEMGAPPKVSVIYSGGHFFGAMAAAPGGGLFASLYYSGVYKLTPPNGGVGTWSATSLNIAAGTRGVGLDSTGNSIWVGGHQFMGGPSCNTLAQYDLTGKPIGKPIGRSQAEGYDPATFEAACGGNIDVDDNGNVWQVDACAFRVLKFDPFGKLLAVYGNGIEVNKPGPAADSSFYAPRTLVVVKTDVYVACYNGTLMKIDAARALDDPQAVSEHRSQPITLGAPGDTWIPSAPSSMVVDRQGNLYIPFGFAYRAGKGGIGQAVIARIPDYGKGTPALFAGVIDQRGGNVQDCGPKLGSIGQIALDPASDTVYAADGVCGVLRIDGTGKLGLAKNFGATALSFGPVEGGKQTLFANQINSVYKFPDASDLGKFDPYSGTTSNILGHYGDGPLDQARFWVPWSFALSRKGDRLYISDTYNDRLRLIWLK